MAARPAKRQRRSTIVVSDDDDDTTTESSSLPLLAQRTSTKLNKDKKQAVLPTLSQDNRSTSSLSTKPSSAKPSPSPSPQKSRKNSKQVLDNKSTKSLHNFFNRATEEQRWQRRAETPQQESQEDFLADDIIDDDSLDDELLLLSQGQSGSQSFAPPSKSFMGGRINNLRSSTPSSSQKFARSTPQTHTSGATIITAEVHEPTEQKPWADRFGPNTLEELAIHKKKVADVQKWVEDAISGYSPQRMLVLKGPAGSGKSTTISLLARNLGIEVIPWQNPAVFDTGNSSSVQQFGEFLDQGGQFQALSLVDNTIAGNSNSILERQLLLVEEFPTTMTRSSNVLEAFRSTLMRYILQSANRPTFHKSSITNRPVILVVSETLVTSSTALSDSFTAHRLLGPELSHHPLVSIIEFNPVAPTFIAKAIDLVIKKEARESQRKRTPGAAVLQQLTEVGDIRSAINSLEFLCARGDNAADWSGTIAARSKKSSKGTVPLTEVEKNALQLISQRESTLDMFHATGKIVYNKREDPRAHDSRAEPPPKPPDHLMHLYTPKVSQVNVDDLLNETGTDIQTLISTVHENYVLSCNGDDFVEAFDGCSSFLSDSDFLNPESRSLIRAKASSRSYGSNLQTGNSDMLRQDEISFQVATRGILFSLPFPVNRAVPAGTRKQDSFKMFYPASLRLWKPAEEVYDLISLYADGNLYLEEISPGTSRHVDGVASWKSRSLAFGTTTDYNDVEDDVSTTLSRSSISRDNLVIDLLPYLTMTRTAQKRETHVLKKITQLRGINISGDELLDEEQYNATTARPPAAVRLQQKVEEAHSMLQAQKSRAVSILEHKRSGDVTAMPQEKLYISDDDIQDD